MKIEVEGGFWKNFKGALGLGLGGGLGAGFGWRFGQGLADVALKVLRWGAIALIGVLGGWFATSSQKPSTAEEAKAAQIQRAEKRLALEQQAKTNPALRQLLNQMDKAAK